MGALHLIAHANATGAQYAAIVIHAISFMGNVYGQPGKDVLVAHVVYAYGNGQILEFAMAIGNAHGAHVVAFCKEQFHDHLAIITELLRVCAHFHSLCYFGGASRNEPRAAYDLYQAEAAGSYIGEAVQVAKGGNMNACFSRGLEDGAILLGTHHLAVNA